jgi:hypothetical protein
MDSCRPREREDVIKQADCPSLGSGIGFIFESTSEIRNCPLESQREMSLDCHESSSSGDWIKQVEAQRGRSFFA